jgi:hypothetical protein
MSEVSVVYIFVDDDGIKRPILKINLEICLLNKYDTVNQKKNSIICTFVNFSKQSKQT